MTAYTEANGKLIEAAEYEPVAVGPAQLAAVNSELEMRETAEQPPNAMRASSRARGAPKQKWMPCPNPRCGRGSRLMSSIEGVS